MVFWSAGAENVIIDLSRFLCPRSSALLQREQPASDITKGIRIPQLHAEPGLGCRSRIGSGVQISTCAAQLQKYSFL